MNRWIIKFLTGMHQGAEIPLKDGDYKIGCADTDDLILTDAALVENHFTLHLGETSAEISLPKEREPIFIGDNATKPYSDEQDAGVRYSVAFPQMISVGTLKIVIGLKTENWQAVNLPEIRLNQESDIKNSTELNNKLAHKDVNTLSRSIKYSMYTGAFVALALASIMVFKEDQSAIEEDIRYTTQAPKWEQVKGTFRSEYLSFNENENGAEIKGRLKNQSDLTQLITIMELANIQAKTDIIIDEELKQSLIQELSKLKEDSITVKLGENPGELVVEGTTNQSEKLEKLITTVKTNNTDIINITNNAVADNQVSIPRNIRMGLNVRSVNIGRTPYFITDDGQKFVNGSTLLSGLIIDDINTKYIQLKKGEEIYLHQLGSN
ncbi:MAG: type III secretion system YscD/HrpQ family protein [Oceanicoccus sp.]|jgi:type III secretion system YscD/HrpQ family protein